MVLSAFENIIPSGSQKTQFNCRIRFKKIDDAILKAVSRCLVHLMAHHLSSLLPNKIQDSYYYYMLDNLNRILNDVVVYVSI